MDDVVGIIYKATHRDEQIVYVGKTTKSLEIRRRQHLYDAVYGSALHFHRALRKYGEAAFDWSVIDEAATEQELNEKERYWIQFYKSFYPYGYNLTFGGEGANFTSAVKEKLSSSLQGRKLSSEHKKNIGDALKGCVGSMTGRQFSTSHKEKISSAMAARWAEKRREQVGQL